MGVAKNGVGAVKKGKRASKPQRATNGSVGGSSKQAGLHQLVSVTSHWQQKDGITIWPLQVPAALPGRLAPLTLPGKGAPSLIGPGGIGGRPLLKKAPPSVGSIQAPGMVRAWRDCAPSGPSSIRSALQEPWGDTLADHPVPTLVHPLPMHSTLYVQNPLPTPPCTMYTS